LLVTEVDFTRATGVAQVMAEGGRSELLGGYPAFQAAIIAEEPKFGL
jgi:hypothetical protein